MTEKNAQERGKETAGQWLLGGTVPVRASARQANGDLSAIFRFSRRLDGEKESKNGVWILDQLWLLNREGEQAVSALSRPGRTPAVHWHGTCARVQLLGEQLAGDQAGADQKQLMEFLKGVQSVSLLGEEELANLPACLVLGVLHQVRNVTEHWSEGPETEEALRHAFAVLRTVSGRNWGRDLEAISRVHQIFSEDADYSQMSREGRAAYRRRLARLARRERLPEDELARQMMERAKNEGCHIGFLLFPPRKGNGGWYPTTVLGLTAALSVGIAVLLGRWWSILLTLLPLSEVVKQLVDYLSLRFAPSRPVFQLEWEEGLPPEGKTLCVISALLSDGNVPEELAAKLERYYLANRTAGQVVSYGLLADLPDSQTPPGPAQRARLEEAQRQIKLLNQRYSAQFYLFIRQPVYVPADDCYRGKERKRGALMELTSLLYGLPSQLTVEEGDRAALTGTAYIITLDSDTQLNVDSVRKLVGVMLHPLNRPVIDERRKIVTQGCGLLQPRIVTNLQDANATTFAALFCGPSGRDPYQFAAADLYHDLFDRASYCGKGIFSVEAAARCLTGRFPDNRILSHDLLEGSVLKARLCSGVELTDGFPHTVETWLRRQHRWVRGDWQAARWMFSQVPNQAGRMEKNPIPVIDRWKLLDNLRRSLFPLGCAFCFCAASIWQGKTLFTSAWLGGTALGMSVLLAGADLCLRRLRGTSQRTFDKSYDGFSGTVFRTLVRVLLLPAEAWVCLSAAVTALWRLTVTHRGLLDWTVSSQEKSARTVWIPNVLAGLVLLLTPTLPGKVLGIFWLGAPLLLRGLSEQRREKERFTPRERAFLLHQAELIWKYFDTWLRPEDHYLPPDNVQELPSVGPARRTSPTNIGLALLSCLAAADLGLTERSHALELIQHQLDTLEGLEKKNGHLYNWYDTETAEPLFPRYISTVDSGNLCGNLITLKQGLLEWNEPVLAARAGALSERMRFEWLYDSQRELFYIGFDAEQNRYTDSWYDLLASEARQTSFLAVARGEVPPRHWNRLSRVMVSSRHRFGLASWSGTMFEYLMPHLLMPAERGTLLRESLDFCVWAQKRWGDKLNLPWGVSESAYNRLDQGQNYQYKAHGVPLLGLQRRLEEERVVAPYATFLALELLPHSGVENLRNLTSMGAEGRFGLCEAVDFTPGRSGSRPVVLHSWMVHHLGMSLLAIDNALNREVMRRRFMAEPAMEAHRELLQERMLQGLVPPRKGQISVRRETVKKIKEYQRSGQGFDPAAPACHLLSCGGLTCLCQGDGSMNLWQEELLLLEPAEVRFATGNEDIQLIPAKQGGQELTWRFGTREAETVGKRDELTLTSQLVLSEHGVLLELGIEAKQSGELTLCLTPVLDTEAAYQAHRAFSRLSLNVEELAGGAVISRRPREGKGYPELAVLQEGWTNLTATENSRLQLRCPIQPGKQTLRIAAAAGRDSGAYYSAQGLLNGALPGQEEQFTELSAQYKLSPQEQQAVDEVTSRLLFPRGRSGIPKGQPALWPYGISGDDPIWSVPVMGEDVTQAERCIRQWAVLRGCGLRCDLVLLLSQGKSGELAEEKLKSDCEALQLASLIGGHGGIHLVSSTTEAVEAIAGMAALHGFPGEPKNCFDLPLLPGESIRTGSAPHWKWEGNCFEFHTGGSVLPRRWSHILTNGTFGWTADDCGTGHLWSGNAHENKLTPWQNDPFALAGPERLFVEENGRKTALFAAKDGIETVVRYGPGFASWEKRWEGRCCTLTAFVPPEGRTRLFLVQTEGLGPDAQLLWHCQAQMSPKASGNQYVKVFSITGKIVAENPGNTQYPGEKLTFSGTVPLELAEQRENGEFLARAPVERELVLSAGLERGEVPTTEAAKALLKETAGFWETRAASLTVRTPDEALNHYLSFWGRYQAIACRLMARTALYQCGGAYGFRDQLQDVCGLLPEGRELAREQILRCCRHQYQEGDVMHWWHPLPEGERGVRTRISDDLLWLPYAVCRWVSVTGDRTLLKEQTSWLTSAPLAKNENQRYEAAESAPETGTVLEHCVRAIECCMGRGSGAHGLLLMGAGDWNDGMDRVGAEGKGESVWLTWFAALVLKEFAPLCEPVRRTRYEGLSARLAGKANDAWDGSWYRRAYDDTGWPLGSKESRECQIDSIAQSFSVFAPNPDPERAKQAVQSAIERLYDPKTGTVALLDPPFKEETGVGYISAYPAGIRENGGQYTHAAVWLAMAAFQIGEAEQGWTLLRTLLPETLDHAAYQGEPYVLAGDVSTAPGREGRVGWSWYTGAASWFCRAAVEELLGLRVRNGCLQIQPALPGSWSGYEADWMLDGVTLRIHVRKTGSPSVTVNGKAATQGIDLAKLTGTVRIQVTI